jgi:predicted kinase
VAKLIILIGPPASGKSTWREKFLASQTDEWVVASTDDLVEEWAAERGLTYNEAHGKAPWGQFNKTFKYAVRDAVKAGKNLIIDRTSMSAKNRKDYFKDLPEGTQVEAVVFVVDDVELKRRMKAREEATGKSVPLIALLSMQKRYQAPTREEGFSKITYIRS